MNPDVDDSILATIVVVFCSSALLSSVLIACHANIGPDRTCPSQPAPAGTKLSDTGFACDRDTAFDSGLCDLWCIDAEVCPEGRGHYCVSCSALHEWWASECDGTGNCQSDWQGDKLRAACDLAK